MPRLGGDVVAISQARVQQALGVGGEEVHGKVHARRLAAGDGQVARARAPSGQHDRVGGGAHRRQVHVGADVRARHKRDALLRLRDEPGID